MVGLEFFLVRLKHQSINTALYLLVSSNRRQILYKMSNIFMFKLPLYFDFYCCCYLMLLFIILFIHLIILLSTNPTELLVS